MKTRWRKTSILLLLLLFSAHLYAETVHTITEHGTYVINGDGINRLSIYDDLFLINFWHHYAAFRIEGTVHGFVIVNTENSSVFSWDDPGWVKFIDYDVNGSLTVFIADHIYRLEPESLQILETEYVGKKYSDLLPLAYDIWMLSEEIDEQTIQFLSQDDNEALTIIFSGSINPHYARAFYNKALNLFILTVHTARY